MRISTAKAAAALRKAGLAASQREATSVPGYHRVTRSGFKITQYGQVWHDQCGFAKGPEWEAQRAERLREYQRVLEAAGYTIESDGVHLTITAEPQ